MINIKKKLKKYEERAERISEDPTKKLQIFMNIVNLACCDLDGKRIIEPPVPEEKKVAFWEFVKYFGNMHVENSLQDAEHIAQAKKFVLEIEQEIKKIDGFSNYDLPEGLTIKYK
jgi:hypothetical protein